MDSIPYTRVPNSSALLIDYLYHPERVAEFYNGSPFELSSYQRVAAELQGFHKLRREVAEVLQRQNQAFGSGEPTFANIRRLEDRGTLAVVTGQQVGLFSGPAFTLYKALTAVRMTQWLTDQGISAVPVFWLATEDHDLEEVSATAVLDEDYNLVPLSDAGEGPAARASVGRVKFSPEITATLQKLEAALPAGEPRDILLRDLRSSYQPGAGWGAAFGRLMARLFRRWGVVLMDALDEGLHRLAAPVYERAIRQAQEFRSRLEERSQALTRAGYHAQVHVGEDSTLLFVTQESSRLALHQRGAEFSLSGTKPMTEAELLARLAASPLDFSPNALMRPIVQDMLLPTVAYVAGPSELAYHGQTQVLYSAFGRPQPVLFPRAAFTLVDRRVARTIEKYHLNLEEVWKGEEYLGRKLVGAASAEEGSGGGWSERFDQSERELTILLERLRKDIQAIDATLLDSLTHAEEKIKYQLERLKGKLARAALERSELLRRHEQSLLKFLTPGKELQEREVSGAYFLGRAGYELLGRILEQIQVTSSDHQVMVY